MAGIIECYPTVADTDSNMHDRLATRSCGMFRGIPAVESQFAPAMREATTPVTIEVQGFQSGMVSWMHSS